MNKMESITLRKTVEAVFVASNKIEFQVTIKIFRKSESLHKAQLLKLIGISDEISSTINGCVY